MEVDPPQDPPSKPEMLQGFNSGQLPSYVSKLSGSSRGIPFDKDFHFYRNFDEFKSPIKEIEKKSQVLLAKIGSSENLWGKKMDFPEDLDDAYDWLVNVNDEVFERFDVSVDEFRSVRRKEEETGVRVMSPVDLENGFQMVYGKKSKKGHSVNQAMEEAVHAGENLMEVKVASRDAKAMGTVKPKIPFHIPTIPRPQDQYKILVNNSNQPFEHVWLQRSEDGSKFIHPLENLSVLDFVDKNITDVEHIKPLPVECTPFKHVVEVKDLKELAAKLRAVDEFAVDLEHNQYRSFQGLTCLMQISTRTEDFVVDTLKLRVHIGPYLREVFKDPTKRKVLHGADRDILWLQRDFSIYVCNMFDTGQASRVLKLERNSLEHLLQHFCGVTANKEYQNADWRLRPLPSEMLRYAREDTHYLLHIYDLMKRRLLSLSNELDDTDSPLIEVYKRSYDICMQLYEKDILTDSSYLYIYGLHGANFNARQLAVVAGLCEWRDVVARAEDESTGYILPNKTLLDIAKQMPYTTYNLRRLVKSKHPYVEHNLDSVVSIIRHSILNEAAFEDAAKRLKEARIEMASQLNTANTDGSQPEANPELGTSSGEGNVSEAGNAANYNLPKHHLKGNSSIGQPSPNRQVKTNIEGSVPGEGPTLSGHIKEKDTITNTKASNLATVQLLKKPSRAFGALLGNSAKRKFDTENKEKEEKKLEQIKSSVNLPFHSFPELSAQHSPPNRIEPPARLTREEQVAEAEAEAAAEPKAEAEAEAEAATTSSKMVDIILLDSDSDQEGTPKADENMSLSDLSSSFQKCFQSKQGGGGGKSADSSGFLQLEPFDYEAARKQVRFGETRRGGGDEQEVGRRRGGGGGRKKINALGHELKDGDDGEMTSDLPQGRRRQAFPATGNRSATFL